MTDAVTKTPVSIEQWFMVMQQYRRNAAEHYDKAESPKRVYRFDQWARDCHGIISWEWIQTDPERGHSQGYYQIGFQTARAALVFKLKH